MKTYSSTKHKIKLYDIKEVIKMLDNTKPRIQLTQIKMKQEYFNKWKATDCKKRYVFGIFGNLYGIPIVIDDTLKEDYKLIFEYE